MIVPFVLRPLPLAGGPAAATLAHAFDTYPSDFASHSRCFASALFTQRTAAEGRLCPPPASGGGKLRSFAHGALLDVLHRIRHMDQALDENARRDDVVGIDLARLDQILDFGHRHLARGRHHRIKIARGLAVNEVAFGIAEISVHDRQIGDDAALHDVALAVELAHVLALGDLGADAGLGEERRDAGAAGADAFGERALRVELDLELA